MVDVESVGGSLFAEVDHFLLYVFGQFDLVAFDGEVVGVEMKRVELLAGRHFLLRVRRYQLVYLLEQGCVFALAADSELDGGDEVLERGQSFLEEEGTDELLVDLLVDLSFELVHLHEAE